MDQIMHKVHIDRGQELIFVALALSGRESRSASIPAPRNGEKFSMRIGQCSRPFVFPDHFPPS
jgi:hypothetical protein